MQRFYQARDDLEAQLLIDYLGASHIRATVLGRYQSGAAGELSALTYPWVWLAEERDLQRAQELLADFQRLQAGAHTAAPWRCAECGNQVEGQFDLCWQCGAGRPL